MAKQDIGKLTLMVILALLIVVGGGAYASVRQQNKLNEQEAQVLTEDENKLISEALALYYDAGRIFLKADLTQAEIDEINKKSENIFNQSEAELIMVDIQNKFNIQTDVNNLFKPLKGKQPLNGPILQRYNLIRPELTQNKIDEIKKKYRKQLPNPKVSAEKVDGFYATVAHLIEAAEKQVALLRQISEQLDQLDSAEEITYEQLTMALDVIRKEIASLENPHFKAYLIEIVGEAERELKQKIGKLKISNTRNTDVSAENLQNFELEADKQVSIVESVAEMFEEEPNQANSSYQREATANESLTDDAYSGEWADTSAYQPTSAEALPAVEIIANEIMVPSESVHEADEEEIETKPVEQSADSSVQEISSEIDDLSPASDISRYSTLIESTH